MTYIMIASGMTPYKTNVNVAPSTVPVGEVASARAIMSATYIQPRATRCMPYPEKPSYNMKN